MARTHQVSLPTDATPHPRVLLAPHPRKAGDKWGSLSELALRPTCLLSAPVHTGLGLPQNMCTLPHPRDPLPGHLLCVVGGGSGL